MKKILLILLLIPLLISAQSNKYKYFYQREIYLSDFLDVDNTPQENGLILRNIIALYNYDLYHVTDSFAVDRVTFYNSTIHFYPSGNFYIVDSIRYDGSFIDAGPFKIHNINDSIIVNNIKYSQPYPEWLGSTDSVAIKKVNRLFPMKLGGDTIINYYDTTINNYYTNSNYFFNDTTYIDTSTIQVHRKYSTTNEKVPLIDLILETDQVADRNLGGLIRGYVKDVDNTHFVSYIGYGLSDTTTDGKLWLLNYWSLDGQWHGIAIEKDFVWINDVLILKSRTTPPPVPAPGMMYRDFDGDLWIRKDTIWRRFLTDEILDNIRLISPIYKN